MNPDSYRSQPYTSSQPMTYETVLPRPERLNMNSAAPGNEFGNNRATQSASDMEPQAQLSHEPPASQSNTRVPSNSSSEANQQLALDLKAFNALAAQIREGLVPANGFEARCRQAFDIANDLFGHAPTWVCFFREMLGGKGIVHDIFDSQSKELGNFLRTEQYHQIQLMLTALRSRDLPENDPNDPQRMITVRLPKSLHEAMCEEAGRLNISVNRLCISRMLQLLDPEVIPETKSKPRGRKPQI